MCLEISLKYKVKQNKNGKFPTTIRLAQSILKCKFPFIDKPLWIQAPSEISSSKRAFKKNISPGAYFQNFTVMLESVINTEGLFPKLWNLTSYSGGKGEVGGGGGATGYAILKKGLGGEGGG